MRNYSRIIPGVRVRLLFEIKLVKSVRIFNLVVISCKASLRLKVMMHNKCGNEFFIKL